ncbi:hypothetical protein Q3H59_004162 [Pantoea sp. SORGH_AS 659]|nr:hypothetical protein [Pantoea sp. SORGH_AS_0659]
MHSSLAVTTQELPLGLTAVKFWTRKKFRGTNALKRKINPPASPLRKKKVTGGWIIYDNQRIYCNVRSDAYILATVIVIFTNRIVWHQS